MSDDVYEAGQELPEDAKAFLANEDDDGDGLSQFTPLEEEKTVDDDPDPEAATENVVDPNEGQPAPSPEEDEDYQDALKLGWAPQEKWKGDPGKWVDHQTFLKRMNRPSVWKERLERIEKTNEERFQRLNQKTAQMLERAKAEKERQLQQELQSLRNERDRLINYHTQNSDPESATRVADNYEKAVADTQKEFSESLSDFDPEPPQQSAPQQAVVDWMKQRPQLETDPAYNQLASHYAREVIARLPAADAETQLAEVDKALAKRFPEYYPETSSASAAPKAPPANSRQPDGVRMNATGNKTNYAAKLNAQEKAMGKQFVEEGLYKDLNAYAKELYA